MLSKFSTKLNMIYRTPHKFVTEEKLLFKNQFNFIVKKDAQKTLEIFFLNNFIRQISRTQHLQAIIERLYGVGSYRAYKLVLPLTYFPNKLVFKNITRSHYDLVSDLLENSNFLLKY